MTDDLAGKPALYQTILARKSCRRFDTAALSEKTLAEVQQSLQSVAPLCTNQSIQFCLLNEMEKSRLAIAQGAYGRFIVSQHLTIPFTDSKQDPLIELGYQSQQAVIKLEELGLASCYVGAHGRVRKLREEFNLGESVSLAALIIYGKPANTSLEKNLDLSWRSIIGSRKRKPIDNIFLESRQIQHNAMPSEFDAILEAGRWAPSATNAQPWRIAWMDDELQLFTDPSAYPIVLTVGSKLMYALYDAGIFMANISLAALAFGIKADWRIDHQTRFPDQKSLIPVARLTFS